MPKKKYFTEEERKAGRKNRKRRFLSSKKGRASMLLSSYRRTDKERNRGECTLTAEWIIQNIFSGQVCAHCGESDWRILGCNRLDNSLPHTTDNVEPCCKKCNNKMEGKERAKPVLQYSLDGEFIKEWESAMECGRNGFFQSSIVNCCNGKYGYKTTGGYIWRYKNEVV